MDRYITVGASYTKYLRETKGDTIHCIPVSFHSVKDKLPITVTLTLHADFECTSVTTVNVKRYYQSDIEISLLLSTLVREGQFGIWNYIEKIREEWKANGLSNEPSQTDEVAPEGE